MTQRIRVLRHLATYFFSRFAAMRRLQGTLLALTVAVVVVLLLWKAPQWQASDVMPTADDPNARLTIQNELHRTIARVLAGLFVLGSGFLAGLNVRTGQDSPARNHGPNMEVFTA